MFDGIDSLRGRAFLAPLAGISNLPFRLIARSFGCALAYTEMVSANGLTRNTEKTFEYLQSCAEDKPLGVQIFGADPQSLVRAACIACEHGADLIDVNMGCPVKKVIKTGAGAMLMKDPGAVGRIVAAVKKAVPIPVTVKIRSGWNRGSINAVEIARIAADAGADAVAVHGRTADQGYSGTADWKVIAAVKEALRIPVIGNGDIWQPQDAVKMMVQTSCDAVMVGRGALGNPWIFAGINQMLDRNPGGWMPDLRQRYEIIKKHWSMEAELCDSRVAARKFRKHLLWYTKGLEGSSCFRNLVSARSDGKNMLDELDKYFRSLTEDSIKIMT